MPALPGATWIDVQDGLAEQLSVASVAVVAGGVTLYEACALGVPVVAVALNAAQHVTIRAVARRGAAVDAGSVASGSGRRALASGFSRSTAASRVSRSTAASGVGRSTAVASGFSRKKTIDRVGREVDRLLRDPSARRRMALAGRRLVDARGAARVAARLRQLPAVVAGRIGHVV